jgi:hypothetical protein
VATEAAQADIDVLGAGSPQSQYVLCERGQGRFESSFAGVNVAVGATKSGGFSQHSCAASLAWAGHELPVATEAAQVDIDVLGADLGLDTPVVAFQVRKSAGDREMTYLIYSLTKPPQLLRSITGGNLFRAADADLSGRNVIWTRDVAALRGFEEFSPDDFEFAPAMALRVEHNQLVDASAEFPAYFDGQIGAIRAGLSAQEISDFRQSDGRLAEAPPSAADRTRRLRSTKVKVLEIVWSYLYSGRDRKAWETLAEMWPPADLSRIRTAILNAQARGIRSQVESVSPETRELPRNQEQVHIYNLQSGLSAEHVDRKPQAIMLTGPLLGSERTVDLVIDSAGKVRAVRLFPSRPRPSSPGTPRPSGLEAGLPGSPQADSDQELLDAAAGWKFIPAFKKGKPVACSLRMNVSLLR